MSQEVKVPQALSEGEFVSGQITVVYAATRNQDLTEGKGRTIDHSYYLTGHAARIATSGIDVMGSDGKVEPRLALHLSDGRFALSPVLITISEDPEAEAKLREQALKKLTPAERAALLGGKE